MLCGVAVAASACYKDAGEDIPPTVKLSDLDATLPSAASATPFVMPSATPGVMTSPTTDSILPSPAATTPTRMPTITQASPITPTQMTLPSTDEIVETVPTQTPTPTMTVTFILTPGLSDFPTSPTPIPTSNSVLQPTPTGVVVTVDPCVHVVQTGDTLYSIAQSSEVLLDELIAANPDLLGGSEYTTLQLGWELRIPGCMQETATPAPGETLAPTAAGPSSEQQTHVVQPGETVFSIAQRYGVSVDAIVQANNLRTQGNIVYISAGQTLIIPPAE
jgi:LysM repeat protein